jgi:hypothetical protein
MHQFFQTLPPCIPLLGHNGVAVPPAPYVSFSGPVSTAARAPVVQNGMDMRGKGGDCQGTFAGKLPGTAAVSFPLPSFPAGAW